MSIPIYDPKEDFLGAGNLASYTFDFLITDPSQLLVVVTDPVTQLEIARVRGTDTTILSSVTYDPVNGGGTVNFLTNIPMGARLLLLQANDAPAQPAQFKNKFDFTLSRVEAAFDNLAMSIQRVSYLAQRGFLISDLESIANFNPMIPWGVTQRPGGIPTINATGTGWEAPAVWVTKPDIASAIAAGVTAANAAIQAGTFTGTASAAAVSAQASQTSATNSASAAVISANQAANSATTAVQNATLTSQDRTATAASAVTAQNAAAAAVVSATSAQTSMNAANGAALAAQNSQNAAATSANNAATSEANALASKNAAANSATTAQTAAGNSATSANQSAASAVAAQQAASSVGAPVVTGTKTAPYLATAATTIPFASASFINILFLAGNGGPQNMSAVPQIQAGSYIGQTLELMSQDDTNVVVLSDGNGLQLNGAWYGQSRMVLGLIWDGYVWVERFRS